MISNVILVIDDEKSMELLYKLQLRKLVKEKNITIHFKNNACEALDYIKDKAAADNIIAIFSDINMPHMDGITFLREVQDIPEEIPSYLVSAYDKSQYEDVMKDLKIEGYLQKPIDFDEITIAITKHL